MAPPCRAGLGTQPGKSGPGPACGSPHSGDSSSSLGFTLEPGVHDCRVWELHMTQLRELDHFLEELAWKEAGSSLEIKIMVRGQTGVCLCLGISWPCHLLALRPWQRDLPLTASVFSSTNWGYQALPHSALESPTSPLTRVFAVMGTARGCKQANQPATPL